MSQNDMSEINPYQTPAVEETVPERIGTFETPSLQLTGSCVLILWVVSSAIWYWLGYYTTFALLPTVVWFICGILLNATNVGIGIALVIQTIRKRQFAHLMPGHWRLIAFATTIVGQEVYIVLRLISQVSLVGDEMAVQVLLAQGGEAVLSFLLYLFVLLTTHETRLWRIYAWICLIYNVLLIPQALLISLIISDGFSDFTNLYSVIVTMANTLAFVAFVALVIAVVWDFRQKVQRDAYHTLGIFLPIIASSATWLLGIMFRWF